MRRWAGLLVVLGVLLEGVGYSQNQTLRRTSIILAPVALMSRPTELDFMGGGCDLDPSGDSMVCTFQQALLIPEKDDPSVCSIYTNRYEQTFKKQDAATYISNKGPDGECGVVAVTTLKRTDNGLPSIWTVNIDTRKIVTNKDAAPICKNIDERPELLSWNYLH
jgi:hypothetical protein